MNLTAIYREDTGEVVTYISSPSQAEILENTPNGFGAVSVGGVLEGAYFDGVQVVQRSAKPSPFHEWDWYTKSWLPDLDAARSAQTQAWNTWRDSKFRAGHNGYHCDDTFISELQLVLKGYERGHLAPDQLTAIRKMDNTVVQLTAAQVEALLLETGLYRQSIYQQSWVGKDALKTMTTLEDILAGGPPT